MSASPEVPPMGDHDPTPPLAAFRAVYETDDNWWWRITCGHHQNLFEAACEEIDRLNELVAQLKAGRPRA